MPLHHEVLIPIQAQLVWQVAWDAAHGHYLGVCQALNLNAVGDTWPEFQEAANEALQMLLEDLFEDDELEQFLRRRGWQPLAPLPSKGSGTKPTFHVPWTPEQRRRVEELIPA